MRFLVLIGLAVLAWRWYGSGLSAAVGDAASPAAGGPLDPAARPQNSRFAALVVNNSMEIQDWAWRNVAVTSAIVQVESGGNPLARGADGEIGVMQVKPETAEQMYAAGYTRYTPDPDNLATMDGGLYFGTAYLDWLSQTHAAANWEWIVQAYNGGPGFETQGTAYVQRRVEYLAKVKAAMVSQREA